MSYLYAPSIVDNGEIVRVKEELGAQSHDTKNTQVDLPRRTTIVREGTISYFPS